MSHSSGICPITNQKILGGILCPSFSEYHIEYNNHNYTLRLSLAGDWDSPDYLKQEEKIALKGMLFNNEWPIEKETILSKALIGQLMRFAEFPSDFESKWKYYILKCYLSGGKEYIPIDFDVTRSLDIYTEDEDEYDRLMSAMVSKRLITLHGSGSVRNKNSNRKLSLTEEGIQLGVELNDIKKANEPVSFSGAGPQVTIYSDKADDLFSNRLMQYLLDFNITVHI